jgi:extradiol dioxygenase family protein
MTRPFHLSCRVTDLGRAVRFYAEVLGCEVGDGNAGEGWTDIDFFGHQLTLHQGLEDPSSGRAQILDHFGLTLPEDEWRALLARTQAAEAHFLLVREPREPGQPDPRGKFVITDPDGTGLEFKCQP